MLDENSLKVSDRDILEKVQLLKQISSSSNRTDDYPDINVGQFTSDSEEVDQIIDKFVDLKKHGNNYELSQECWEKADEIFSLFEKDCSDQLVDEEMFVNHWTRL